MGATQRQWFFDRLHDRGAKWKIVAQQVMVAPLTLGSTILNNDQWDGYPADRQKMYNTILQDSIKNVAILTGDIHTSWANNLRVGGDSGDSVAVEFVTTSITSQGAAGVTGLSPTLIYNALPHVKYVNLTKHGYTVLDITNAKTQSDYYYVSTIDTPVATTALEASWYVNSNERFLRSGTASAPYATPLPPQAPAKVQTFTGINTPADPQNVVILGAYPNPTDGSMLIQYYQLNEGNASAQVYDLSGKMVYEKPIAGQKGVNYTQINLDKLGID